MPTVGRHRDDSRHWCLDGNGALASLRRDKREGALYESSRERGGTHTQHIRGPYIARVGGGSTLIENDAFGMQKKFRGVYK